MPTDQTTFFASQIWSRRKEYQWETLFLPSWNSQTSEGLRTKTNNHVHKYILTHHMIQSFSLEQLEDDSIIFEIISTRGELSLAQDENWILF